LIKAFLCIYRKNSLTLGAKALNLLITKGGVTVRSTTIRISEKKRDTLKIIASIEKREMKEILSELIDEYIERHKETLELLSKPEWLEIIEKGKEEVARGVRGKSLDELED
jgi:predicted transcriptional regulator